MLFHHLTGGFSWRGKVSDLITEEGVKVESADLEFDECLGYRSLLTLILMSGWDISAR